jgi:hypothetical protein
MGNDTSRAVVLSPTVITHSNDFNQKNGLNFIDASASSITIALPDISNKNGISFIFSRIDSSTTNTVHIKGFNSTQTICSPDYIVTMTQNDIFRIISVNGVWRFF